MTYHNYGMVFKSQTQPGSGEGCSGITTVYPVTVHGKAVALLRQGTANAWGDAQKSSEAGLVGRIRNTGRSPLTTINQVRILGARVQKDTCLPREARCISEGVRFFEAAGIRDNRLTKSPVSSWNRILRGDELNSAGRGTQNKGVRRRESYE